MVSNASYSLRTVRKAPAKVTAIDTLIFLYDGFNCFKAFALLTGR